MEMETGEELAACAANLAELGYRYIDDALQLRSIEGDHEFKFDGQPHYEKLAVAVYEFVQAYNLEKFDCERLKMKKTGVDIYRSKGAEMRDAMLVIICGTGQVMAGQWARKLCINDDLYAGSVINYIKWAQELGLGVLILNPNHKDNGFEAEQHVIDAWREWVEPSAAKHVVIVAHSYGGVSTCELLEETKERSLNLLRGISFTDSVHGRRAEKLSPAPRAFFCRNATNWVTSRKPLDELLARTQPLSPQAITAEPRDGWGG